MSVDRQRIAAVRTLEALGYTYQAGEWKLPHEPARSFEADATIAWDASIARPRTMICRRAFAVLETSEAKRWPGGKRPGGR
jgi:hypothetical protein